VAGLPVIALVSSVGGLEALSRVLRPLPADFPAAVIALQHQTPDRASGLSEILGRRCRMRVADARQGEALTSSRVAVAPAGRHVLVNHDLQIVLIASGPFPPHRPSADLLLTTLALAAGPLAVAVVLSGGGNDGATGASAVHDLGGTVIAADRASSLAYSMPEATIGRQDAVDRVCPVDDIADVLMTIVRRRPAR
jgi:two-component system chemotaxis response regulator CheB